MQPQRSVVDVEGARGPFDLLLELIREHKLDVSTLSLSEITNDFLTYLTNHPIRPEFLGDFLVVAATLLLVKARQFSPTVEPEAEEEIEQLRQRLTTYREFRLQGRWIGRHWNAQRLFSMGSFALPHRQKFTGRLTIRLEHLAAAMKTVTENLPKAIGVHIQPRPQGKSLKECIDFFWSRLHLVQELIFQHAVSQGSRQDVATSFLAVLELARQQQIRLTQTEVGGELMITRL